MQAQRYQRGSLSLLKRKSQPDAWVFRYYAEKGGRRVYKKKIVGTRDRIPEANGCGKGCCATQGRRNHGASFAPMNLGQLVTHFKSVELPLIAYSTVEGYKNYLDLHILAKWGHYTLSAIKSVDVESWLRSLKRVDGQAASPGTKTKIRNLFSAVFSHAIRYEWAAKNPITPVRTSAKRCALRTFSPPTSSRRLSWCFHNANVSWSCWLGAQVCGAGNSSRFVGAISTSTGYKRTSHIRSGETLKATPRRKRRTNLCRFTQWWLMN